MNATFASVTTPLVPELSIEVADGVVRVSWPTTAVGWFLQQHEALAGGDWTPSSGVEDDGVLKSLTIPGAAGRRFYRLALP